MTELTILSGAQLRPATALSIQWQSQVVLRAEDYAHLPPGLSLWDDEESRSQSGRRSAGEIAQP